MENILKFTKKSMYNIESKWILIPTLDWFTVVIQFVHCTYTDILVMLCFRILTVNIVLTQTSASRTENTDISFLNLTPYILSLIHRTEQQIKHSTSDCFRQFLLVENDCRISTRKYITPLRFKMTGDYHFFLYLYIIYIKDKKVSKPV